MDKSKFLYDRYFLFLRKSAPPIDTFEQKVFCTISDMYWGVHMFDGFASYFGNFADQVGFIVEALETVGALKTADIVRRAIGLVFPQGLPENLEQLKETAYAFGLPNESGSNRSEEMDDLLMEFLQHPDNMTSLLFDYVSGHPSDFGPIPICEKEGGPAIGWA